MSGQSLRQASHLARQIEGRQRLAHFGRSHCCAFLNLYLRGHIHRREAQMSDDASSPLSKAVVPQHEGGMHDFPMWPTAPVTIYLSSESGHEQVEHAVDDLVVLAGFRITERDDPVLGSWFRRMRASLARAGGAPAREAVVAATAHQAELLLLQRTDAVAAEFLRTGVAPLLASLKETENAVIRVGALLIVKSGGTVQVMQLTARQQLILDHSPDLLAAPERVLQAVGQPTNAAELMAGTRLSADGGQPGSGRPSASGGRSAGGQLPASGGSSEDGETPPSAETGVTEPSAAATRPYRRSLAQAFTDGIGGVFDIFGGIQRKHWSPPPAFEDMLAQDAQELCRELGLIPNDGTGSKEDANR